MIHVCIVFSITITRYLLHCFTLCLLWFDTKEMDSHIVPSHTNLTETTLKGINMKIPFSIVVAYFLQRDDALIV